MATAELEARVHDEAGTAVIELTGDVDRDAEAALDAAYAQVEQARARWCSTSRASPYINSTGIAVIVGPARAGAAERADARREGPDRALPPDLRDHAAGGLHDDPRRGGSAMTETLSTDVRRIDGRSPSWTSGATSRRRRRTRSARPMRRGRGRDARGHPQLHGPRVHELGRDRPARHAARAREPGEAEAARVRADRALPPDLRADAPRRGDRHLRHRGRGARRGLTEGGGAMSERIRQAGDVGEAGRPR